MPSPAPATVRPAAVLVAVLAVLGVLMPTTAPAATMTEADGIVIALDWSVPSRYAGLDVASRFDADLDGRPDPATIDELRTFVNPPSWPMDLDACRSALGAGGPSATWAWSAVIDGEQVAIPGDGCRTSTSFPHEGTYTVEVTVTTEAGSATRTDEVQINDILVVGMGDSYGSGEGNPDVEMGPGQRPVWTNPRCHRSSRADQAVAARLLETMDRRSSVTFVHLACSGAQISEPGWPDPAEGGVLSPYLGTLPNLGTGAMPAQVDQLRLLLDGADPDQALDREVDALILSGGGNDMNFVPIMTDCALPALAGLVALAVPLAAPIALSPCYVPLDVPLLRRSGALLYDDGVAKLQHRLPLLDAAFADLGIPLDHVYQREYPDPTWSSPDTRCLSMLFGITIDEGTWASRTVLGQLNRTIREHAEGRWHYVDGVDELYRDDGGIAHGESAADSRWFRWPFESFDVQDDHRGTMHPNRSGHQAQGRLIAEQLTHLLTEAPPACIPVAQASVADVEDGGWELTSTSTSPCGPVLDTLWWVNGRSAGEGPTVRVSPGDLVCGVARVTLSVSSLTGHQGTLTTLINGDPTVPRSSTDRPGSLGQTSAASTSCDGGSVVARGTTSAATGWASCLADPAAWVQPAPGPAPCPSGPRVGHARAEQATEGARESLVVAADRHAHPDDGLDPWVASTATSAGRYLVSSPDGGPVEAELHLRWSQSLRAESGAGCPPGVTGCVIPSPEPRSEASAHATLSGTASVTPAPDPGCGDGDCEPVSEVVATWSVDAYADSCVSCTRTIGTETSWRERYRYAELDGVVSHVRGDGSWTDDEVTPFYADLDGATTWQADEAVVPLTLHDGDVVDTDHLAEVTGGADGSALLSAQQGLELELVAVTPGSTVEPLTVEPVVASAGAVEAKEGDWLWRDVSVPITLSRPADRPVTVTWALQPATAGPTDFVAGSGSTTIAPGRTETVVEARIRSDVVDEADEVIEVALLAATGGATVAETPGSVTILDDDGPPTVSVGDVTVDEGDTGLRLVRVPVTLSAAAPYDVTFRWQTEAGSAVAPWDHWARGPVTTTIPAGGRTATVTVAIVGDRTSEGDESFAVRLLDSTTPGVGVSVDPGTVTIRDDEAATGLRLGRVHAPEGHDGARVVLVPVTSRTAPDRDTTLTYRVSLGTAGRTDVFVHPGSVVLRAGTTKVDLPVFVFGDLAREADETAIVELTDAGGLDVEVGSTQVIITDDD